MALQKTPVAVNFAKGLNNKVDPYQLNVDSFAMLQNSVFDTVGRLTKRNGFPRITTLPTDQQTTITTLNDNLITTGAQLSAFNERNNVWLDQGTVQPVDLESQAILRSATSQVSPDLASTQEGLACLVYVDAGVAYYQISDTQTGQQVVQRTVLPSTATNPRVFLLDRRFIITFVQTVTGVPHLRYIAIPTAAPSNPAAPQDISIVVASLTAAYDGAVTNNTLYLSWADTASSIRTAYLSSSLILSTAVLQAGNVANLLSVTTDNSASTPVIWVTYWDDSVNTVYTIAYNQTLQTVLAKTSFVTGVQLNELTSIATNGSLTAIYEIANTYSFTPNAKTDYLSKASITQAGSITSPQVVLRSVGLASKAFVNPSNSTSYVLCTYGEAEQSTYFLIDFSGNIYMRLAYSNGGGYAASQVLPQVTYIEADDKHLVPYLIKDLLVPINKQLENPGTTPITALYTQTGVNLAKFSINLQSQYSSEIAGSLHLTGGQLWMYDGVKPVEHGFQVWPENLTVTTATGSGSINAGTYYYVFTYEWTDNQGNLHRSAPSIPISIVTTTASSTNTINVPTLRLTYKTGSNPVRLVGYRASVNQPVYYQFTSITSPVLNDTTVDSIAVTDTNADSAILGQTILYTTGGVIENIASPAAAASALFKNRLFIVDAEDRNLLWYSKQVIENTPVEMSDLFTVYVAPTTGSQGSTGPVTALSAMDDKLIIFKKDAIYYMTGTGPNNTGGNNDFNDPVYITSSVGCDNPKSIVLTPDGIMFQSDKGIWLLTRQLGTTYIGSAVENYSNQEVKSAQVIPGTNQVRFILDTSITLVYDYFVGQWGTFTNLSAISGTLYRGLQTYLNSFGEVFQEKPGTYLDGSKPVLMSFTTAWINIAGLQGFERFYFLYLLGTYYTPFKLSMTLAYDYNPSITQQTTITPDNYTKPWGGEQLWGSQGPWGGPGNVFEARLFPQQQKCESFQLTVTEIYDSSLGQAAGQGLSLSGLNIIMGTKKGFRTQRASRSFG